MKWAMVFAVGLLLAAASTATMAFEEQKMPAGGNAASGAGAAEAGMGLTTPDLEVPKNTGTKIRVPGLGVIGEIPKMDFGLELLYGASSQNKQPDSTPEANGVMLRSKIPIGSAR